MPDEKELAPEDKWILTRFNTAARNVNLNLERYEIGIALSTLYDFIWDEYCDWYIELSKPSVSGEDPARAKTAQNVLAWVLSGILRLLHPFMPFITEEIYSGLPGVTESIMIQAYPTGEEVPDFSEDAAAMNKVIGAIQAIRARRAEMQVPPSRKAAVYIVTADKNAFGPGSHPFFARLASAASVTVADTYADDSAVRIVTDSATIYIPLADMVDFAAERKRLEGEKAKMTGEIKRCEGKLSNEGFTAKAPAAVVAAEQAKLDKYKAQLRGIEEALAALPQ